MLSHYVPEFEAAVQKLKDARIEVGKLVKEYLSTATNALLWQSSDEFIPSETNPTDPDDIQFIKNCLFVLIDLEEIAAELFKLASNQANHLQRGGWEFTTNANLIFKLRTLLYGSSLSDLAEHLNDIKQQLGELSQLSPGKLENVSVTEMMTKLTTYNTFIVDNIKKYIDIRPAAPQTPRLEETKTPTDERGKEEPLNMTPIRSMMTLYAKYHTSLLRDAVMDTEGFYLYPEKDSTPDPISEGLIALYNVVWGINRIKIDNSRFNKITAIQKAWGIIGNFRKIDFAKITAEAEEELKELYQSLLEEAREIITEEAERTAFYVQQFELDHHLLPGILTNPLRDAFAYVELFYIENELTIQNPFLSNKRLEQMDAMDRDLTIVKEKYEQAEKLHLSRSLQKEQVGFERKKAEVLASSEKLKREIDNQHVLMAIHILRGGDFISDLNDCKESRVDAVVRGLLPGHGYSSKDLINNPKLIKDIIINLFKLDFDEGNNRLLARELLTELVMGSFISFKDWDEIIYQILTYGAEDTENNKTIQLMVLTKLDPRDLLKLINEESEQNENAAAKAAFFFLLMSGKPFDKNDLNRSIEAFQEKPISAEQIVTAFMTIYEQNPSNKAVQKSLAQFVGRLALNDKNIAKYLFENVAWTDILKRETKDLPTIYYEGLVLSLDFHLGETDYQALLQDNPQAIYALHKASNPEDGRNGPAILEFYLNNMPALCELIKLFRQNKTSANSEADKNLCQFFTAIAFCDNEEGAELRKSLFDSYTSRFASLNDPYLQMMSTEVLNKLFLKIRDDLLASLEASERNFSELQGKLENKINLICNKDAEAILNPQKSIIATNIRKLQSFQIRLRNLSAERDIKLRATLLTVQKKSNESIAGIRAEIFIINKSIDQMLLSKALDETLRKTQVYLNKNDLLQKGFFSTLAFIFIHPLKTLQYIGNSLRRKKVELVRESVEELKEKKLDFDENPSQPSHIKEFNATMKRFKERNKEIVIAHLQLNDKHKEVQKEEQEEVEAQEVQEEAPKEEEKKIQRIAPKKDQYYKHLGTVKTLFNRSIDEPSPNLEEEQELEEEEQQPLIL